MVKRKASEGRHGSQSSSTGPPSRRTGIKRSVEGIMTFLRKVKVKERKKPYELADPLPEGQVMKDLTGNTWKLGRAFATGGFGLIYEAVNQNNSHSNDTPYVIKLEPQSNGPLFCEMHFYQRVCKPEIIKKWMSEKRLKTLGIPTYIGSGCLEKEGKRYRFMVMERFDTDIHKVFEQQGRRFSPKTVFTIALKLVDALQFIHENEYVHADIKGSNLLMGLKKGHKNDVYLVDFGLAYRFMCDGKHREYFEDKRRQHDGTIEYTSRDAHRGVMPSRRGDMEILGYCMLQWLAGKLPWESNLKDPNFVRDQKFKYMKSIQSLMKVCFPKNEGPAHLAQYLIYVDKLTYTDKPDYNHVRSIFKNALQKLGFFNDDKLDLTHVEVTSRLSPMATTSSTASLGKRAGKRSPQRIPDVSSSPVSPVPTKMPRAMKPPKNTPTPSCQSGVESPKKRTRASMSQTRRPRRVVDQTAPKRPLPTKRKAAVTSVAVQTSPGLKGLRKRHKLDPARQIKHSANR